MHTCTPIHLYAFTPYIYTSVDMHRCIHMRTNTQMQVCTKGVHNCTYKMFATLTLARNKQTLFAMCLILSATFQQPHSY